MKKRMVITVVALLLLIGGLGFLKFSQIKAAIAAGAAFQMPPEAVTTVVAGQEQWPAVLNTIGSVVAAHGVTVSADLPGVVEKIDFESGRAVKKGDLLVRLDTSQERAQLASADAGRHLSSLNFDRAKGLLERGVTSQAEYDRMAAELKQAEARVGEIQATIERKTIRAPFSGVLGIRQADLGQYLNSGDPIVPLQALDPVYVNFSVPQQEAGQLGTGAEVRVWTDGGADRAVSGRITAINSVIDEGTRNIQVQATFDNTDGALRPGMFVQVEVRVGAADQVVALPGSAVNYAPYGNSVFVVEQLKDAKGNSYSGVRQQFVQLGPARGDQVAVVSGVKPGEEVVTSGVFKLRNGAAVFVNNKVQPGNDPAPKPEDN